MYYIKTFVCIRNLFRQKHHDKQIHHFNTIAIIVFHYDCNNALPNSNIENGGNSVDRLRELNATAIVSNIATRNSSRILNPMTRVRLWLIAICLYDTYVNGWLETITT